MKSLCLLLQVSRNVLRSKKNWITLCVAPGVFYNTRHEKMGLVEGICEATLREVKALREVKVFPCSVCMSKGIQMHLKDHSGNLLCRTEADF